MISDDIFYKLPKWLQCALHNKEWVTSQQMAWGRYDSPEMFGCAPPQFLEITEENLKQLPGLLAKHYQQAGKRLLDTARELEKIAQVCQYPKLT